MALQRTNAPLPRCPFDLRWPSALFQLFVIMSCASVSGHWVFKKNIADSYLAACAKSTFRSPAANLEFLRNVSVVFFGDSVTRYQFSYLAQFVHLRRWDDPDGNNLSNWLRYGSFTNMFKAYADVFGCRLICDCVDHHLFVEVKVKHRNKKRTQTRQIALGWARNENHYYRHPDLRAALTFHMWVGSQMRLNFFPHTPAVQDFDQYCQDFASNPHAFLNGPLDAFQVYPDLPEFIRAVLRPTMPHVLVLNYGIWKELMDPNFPANASILTEANLDRLAQAAHEVAPVVVWKTTTVNLRGTVDDPELLAGLRRRGFFIFDAYTLTQPLMSLRRKTMFDDCHFQRFVYRELNIALLEFLRDLLKSR